jgi:hypothetical protein
MDYRMGSIIDHGLPRVDSPLRRLAQPQADQRAPSASPHPPPTPVSAITIPMASTAYDHRPPAAPAQGRPPVEDAVLNSMHSTTIMGQVDHPDLELHQGNNGRYHHATATALDLGMDKMMILSPGLDGGQVQVSSYRRSTYPLLQQHPNLHSPLDMMQPPNHTHNMHTQSGMEGLGTGGMGMVEMGWQGVLLPVKAESPPPDRLRLD